MKVKDLIEKLKGYEEFELQLTFYDKQLEPVFLEKKIPWPPYRHLIVECIADVGHSDKVIILSGKEETN